MPGDKELERLIDALVKKLIRHSRDEEEETFVAEAEPGKEFKVIDSSSPHGVYVYNKEKKAWVLTQTSGGPFKPEKDGLYVVYFGNTRCPACKAYDTIWYPYVELLGWKLEDVEFVVVLCEWFTHKCFSEAARNSFKEYNVKASPTTLFVCLKNGEKVFEEKVEGVKDMKFLASKIEEMRGKCRQ